MPKGFLLPTSLGLLLLFTIGGFSYWYFYIRTTDNTDALLRTMFEHARTIQVYSQHVDTQITLSDRHIAVTGEYLLDPVQDRYASFSTTTITIPEEKNAKHQFSLQTISMNDSVYTKISTESDLLRLTIPRMTEWARFNKSAIPETYKDIAIPGPVMDNLALFRENGAYLTFDRKIDTPLESELFRYAFKLSSRTLREKTGPLSMIAERIGEHGVVHVWVDENATIKQILLENSPYHSTTTVHTNTPVSITAPPQYIDQ